LKLIENTIALRYLKETGRNAKPEAAIIYRNYCSGIPASAQHGQARMPVLPSNKM